MGAPPEDPVGTPFQRRPGADPFGGAGWRGVNTEKDPASIEPNELQQGTDIRLWGDGIRNRPGLVEVLELAEVPIRYMSEMPDTNHKLWMTAEGCLSGAVGDNGYQISHVDTAAATPYQVFANQPRASDKSVPIGVFGDKLYTGDVSALKVMRNVPVPYGQTVADVATANATEIVNVFAGYTITFLRDFPGGGGFVIGLSNDAAPTTNSKIVIWDGVSFHDDLTGIRAPLSAGIWRDKIVVGFDATAAHVRVRASGTTYPGVWTTVSLAGFRCSPYQNSMVEVGGLLYIASGGADLYQFDGVAMTLALTRTIAGAESLHAVCSYQGLLHYCWNTTVNHFVRVGRRDPDSPATEFIDSYIDISTAQTNFRYATAMASHRRQIYIGASQFWVVATAEDDPLGTALVVNNGGAYTGAFLRFNPRQLLIFPSVSV